MNRRSRLAALVAAVVIAACGRSPADAAPPDTVTATPVATSIRIVSDEWIDRKAIIYGGQPIVLRVEASDSAGQPVAVAKPEFISRDLAAILVDSTGLMTPITNRGGRIVARVTSRNRVLMDSIVVLIACGSGWPYAITVSILDSVSRQPIPEPTAIYVRDGAFADSTLSARGWWYGIMERPGTYEVTVRSPGYREWVQRDVVVSKTLCSINGARLDALLQR